MIKKLNNKKVIIVSIMIMLTCVLSLSYATFVVTTSDYKASELLVSELSYSLTIYEEGNNKPLNNPITISANTTKTYNVVVSSINKIDSKYILAYENNNNVTVKYSDRSAWNTEDYIKGYQNNENNVYSKEIRIVIENKSNSSQEVKLNIFGGYRYNSYEDINIKGYTKITEIYKEELSSKSEILSEIISSETKCNSSTCLYGGRSKSNYLRYSDNLYRIIGTYTLNNEKVTKIISEYISDTTNITTDLNNIYSSLENKEDIIYKTNKFNCNELNCEETEYNNIGLLTKYEYDLIGGENSYLKSDNGYYILNGTNIETQNGSGSGSLKSVLYLPGNTKVTGSGTISDPYMINIAPKEDISILAYTVNGKGTTQSYEWLLANKAVNKVNCNNGTTATWNNTNKTITFGSIEVPVSCTIDFQDGYKVTMKAVNGSVTSTNVVEVIPGGSATFTTRGTNNQTVSSVSCDGGATVTQSNGVVTVSNVNNTQTCTITYKYHQVTMVANNGGKVTSTNPVKNIAQGNNATFTVNPDSTSPVASHTLSCTNGATATLNGTTVTVTNITNDTTCTIGYRYTVTMNSASCPDTINDNSGACYILAHANGTNPETQYITKINKDWTGTSRVGITNYIGCEIKSYSLKRRGSENDCYSGGDALISTLAFSDKGTKMWYAYYNKSFQHYASCSVVLDCTM